MKGYRLEFILALLFIGVFLLFAHWQAPGSPLSAEEVDRYLASMRDGLPLAEPEKSEFLGRLDAWGKADDGRPIYMMNLMRYYETLQEIPGSQAATVSTEESHHRYERAMLPLVLRIGMYPLMTGVAHGLEAQGRTVSNLLTYDPRNDGWDEFAIVRYPNRRAFFELMSSPEYLALAPLKLAALQIILVPGEAKVVIPDPRLVIGFVLVLAWSLVGWLRSARRARGR